MLFRGARVLFGGGLHALFGNFDVHARAIGEFFAGPLQDFFELLLRFGVLLLMEERQSFVVGFHLSLDERVDEFDAAALDGGRGD